MSNIYPLKVVTGKTAGHASVPFLVGPTGVLNDPSAGAPIVHMGSKPFVVGCGKTETNVSIPVAVSSDGTVDLV